MRRDCRFWKVDQHQPGETGTCQYRRNSDHIVSLNNTSYKNRLVFDFSQTYTISKFLIIT